MIGGLIAFGVIGLFIGPVMLAVTYTLLQAWVKRVEPEREVTGGLKAFPHDEGERELMET